MIPNQGSPGYSVWMAGWQDGSNNNGVLGASLNALNSEIRRERGRQSPFQFHRANYYCVGR